MKVEFLNLQKINKQFHEELNNSFANILDSSSFIGGDKVCEFEENFASFCGTEKCLAVGNGTDALEIIIEALALPQGSDIIVPANSFIATAEAVNRNGLNVKFCDINEKTQNISVEQLKKVVTSKTSAVIFVHLYGNATGITEVLNFCRAKNLHLIEDCAQAHGAYENENLAGSFGIAAAFSFYPGKILGALGDAGAITSNNFELLQKCRKIANHGRLSKYEHELVGRNSRMDTLQAAVLTIKLKALDEELKQRRQIAQDYLLGLQCIDKLGLVHLDNYNSHAYHLFPIITTVSDRDPLREFLRVNQIGTGIHYPVLIPHTMAYQAEWTGKNFSNRLLSLPIGSHLNQHEIKYVIEVVKEYFAK